MKITLQTLGLLVLSLPLAGAAIIADDFSTMPANPNDLGWYSSSGGTSVFSASGGGLQFTSSTANTNQSVFKQFSQTQIPVGQVMTLTLQITALSSVPNSSAIWRIGMYDTNDTFTSNQNAAPWSTTNEGYIFGISTAPSDGGGTLLTNIYHKANTSGIVSTSGANSVTVVDRRMPPSGVTPVTMSMSVERLSSSEVRVSGYWLENGAPAGTLPAAILNSANGNYIDTFDTIYIAYGAGGTGQGFTIDDVNLSVDLVPESSTFALSLLGAFGLLRRRR